MALLSREPIRQIYALFESALLLSILFFRGFGRACQSAPEPSAPGRGAGIVRGPGISAAENNRVMGGGCGKLESVRTKKGAGV